MAHFEKSKAQCDNLEPHDRHDWDMFSYCPGIPLEHPFPGNELLKKYDTVGTGDYSGEHIIDCNWTNNIKEANLLSSEVVMINENMSDDDTWGTLPKEVPYPANHSDDDYHEFYKKYPTRAHMRIHRPVLDIDFPVKVVPSSTEGHFHLYLDKEMDWPTYKKLLEALAEAGIIEQGYASVSIKRKATHVRLPWIKKGEKEDIVFKGNENL